MSTKEQLVAEMENTGIFMAKEMTFVEYNDNLMLFQDMITKLVMGEDYEEGMRVEEAIFRMEAKARKKGVDSDPILRKGISALKTVNKELAISMAGRKGENLVARTLEFIERPNTRLYRNVYVSNRENETELDTVVLTDSGIIILEIKNTKDDVTITEEGRLVHSGDECYDKKPLGEKMDNKRKLLSERLKALVNEKGLNIPICIESLIVFSTPKGVKINVDDRFRREKWCYRTGLVPKINNYIGRAYYSNEQLLQLDEILGMMESQVKRFVLTVNFDEIRSDIAEALVLIREEQKVEETVKETKVDKVMTQETEYIVSNTYSKRALVGKTVAMVAGVFTGLICVSAALGFTSNSAKRALFAGKI